MSSRWGPIFPMHAVEELAQVRLGGGALVLVGRPGGDFGRRARVFLVLENPGEDFTIALAGGELPLQGSSGSTPANSRKFWSSGQA